MLTEEKFFEKAESFFLYPSVDGEFFTYDELKEKCAAGQTDKDGKLIFLYASDKDAQHSYIEGAKAKGYQVLLMNTPIVGHLLQKLEGSKENISFVRVDSDSIDNLIKKEDTTPSKLSEDEKTALKERLETVIPTSTYTVQMESLDSSSSPFVITEPEFMRRMKEMQQTGGGGMFGMGQMPEMYNLVVNTNHELIQKIIETKTQAKQERLIKQGFDLAKLSKNLLKGQDLTQFINRSFELIK